MAKKKFYEQDKGNTLSRYWRQIRITVWLRSVILSKVSESHGCQLDFTYVGTALVIFFGVLVVFTAYACYIRHRKNKNLNLPHDSSSYFSISSQGTNTSKGICYISVLLTICHPKNELRKPSFFLLTRLWWH